MNQRRISLSDLPLGAPLPWDLYPADPLSGPVLRKGQVLADSGQLSRLLEGGLFAVEDNQPSVLNLLNVCNKRLEGMLHELRGASDAERELRDVAREVIRAVEIQPDIALACIFLNQIAGTYAVRHCVETAVVAVLVARAMQKPQRETLAITAAALTMNVGMLRHCDSFLDKRGALTDEERDIVHRHPEDSAAMLAQAGVQDEEWISCVILHHENEDGSGYPAGKSSDEISQSAKLVGLADRYCAHVSARNYRRSVLPDQALQTIFLNQQQPVDPLLAEQFVRLLGKYPPGSLVRLQNGEVGVVTERSANERALRVQALRDATGQPIAAAMLTPASRRNTAEAGFGIVELLHEDQAAVRFSMRSIWGDQARL